MKKLSYTLALLLTASITFSSCNTGGGQSVTINGVRWATHNVDVPGTFTKNVTDAGGYFTFEEAQNACPQGWRVPTRDELQSLVDAGSEWTTKNSVNGRLFGGRRNQLFLPAAGWRNLDGAFNGVDTDGRYWSSTQESSTAARLLWFGNNGWVVNSFPPTGNFSVRCVAK